MKRLLSLIAAFVLAASPALASITQIAGSGTGGSIATASTATGSTQFSSTAVSASVASGNLVVVTVTQRSSTTSGWSCTDSASNTYTAGNATPYSTSSVTTVQTFYSVLTTGLTSGSSVVKCTTGAAFAATFTVTAWTGNAAAGSVYDSGAYAQSGGASGITTLNVGPTGTLAKNCAGGELLVVNAASQGSATYTNGASSGLPFTLLQNSGSATNSAWYISNNNLAVTWTPAYISTAAQATAEQIEGFVAASCPTGTGHTLELMGVGE